MKKNLLARSSNPFFAIGAAMVLVVCTASCASNEAPRAYFRGSSPPAMDPTRRISDQVCSRPFEADGGNLRCM